MDFVTGLAYGIMAFADIKPHLKPIFKVVVDGVEITNTVNNRLISLSIQEERGIKADQLDITLSDHDGRLAIPPDGATVQVWLGFEKNSALAAYFPNIGMTYKGSFKIDERTHQGASDTLSLKGISADLSETLAECKEKSWHKKTVTKIVEEIAKVHELEYKIGERFSEELIDHIDQTNESDASFLTRLADQVDAIAAVKNGLLLFLDAGECVTASGEPIAPIVITRTDGDNHNYSIASTDDYSAVRAYYKDSKSGKKQEIVINKDNLEPKPKAKPQPKGKKKGRPAGTADPSAKLDSGAKVKTLRHIYSSRANAMRGARTAFKKIKRGTAQFSLNLAVGRPEAFPQMPVIVRGWKSQIDNEDWLIDKITHKLDSNGLTSDLSLEARLRLDEEPEAEETPPEK